MKQWSAIIIALLAVLGLYACSSQAPAPPPPPPAVGSLETAEAYLKRGDQYSDLKDYDRAIADYGQAIRLKPDYAEAYNNRGLALALKSKSEMVNAFADYSQAIQLRPTYAYAYNNRGVAYMASGHPAEALRDFDRAIQLQPDLPQAYSNRGNAFYRQGRLDLAIPDFIRAWETTLGVVAILSMLIVLLAVGLASRAAR